MRQGKIFTLCSMPSFSMIYRLSWALMGATPWSGRLYRESCHAVYDPSVRN